MGTFTVKKYLYGITTDRRPDQMDTHPRRIGRREGDKQPDKSKQGVAGGEQGRTEIGNHHFC